jgi:hypothetical protein
MKISLKKAAKVLLFGAAALILARFAVDVAYTNSGSDQWELDIDKNGVKVYSYKAPGSYRKQVRGVIRAKYTQSQIVAALMLDNHSLANCKEWIPVCIDVKTIEPYSAKAQGDTVLYTLELMPPVFTNREYLIKSRSQQDPKTKVVTVDIQSATNKIPLNDCCVRISHIHNRWQITPVGKGEVEIQLTQDFTMGGFFPDSLLNLGVAEETYKLLHDKLPGYLNKEKYINAKLDYIEEGAL